MVEQPSRQKTDLAEMVEMLLDKGVVINADIVVSIGDTELLGVKVRAAVASFETAAEYGLEFPEGTDMDRVEAAAKGERREGLSEAEAPVTVTESSKEELDAAEARGEDDGDEETDEAAFLTEKTPVTGQTPASGQTRTSAETPATGQTPASPDAEGDSDDDAGGGESDAESDASDEPDAGDGDAGESGSGADEADDGASGDADTEGDADDESADGDTSSEDEGDGTEA